MSSSCSLTGVLSSNDFENRLLQTMCLQSSHTFNQQANMGACLRYIMTIKHDSSVVQSQEYHYNGGLEVLNAQYPANYTGMHAGTIVVTEKLSVIS